MDVNSDTSFDFGGVQAVMALFNFLAVCDAQCHLCLCFCASPLKIPQGTIWISLI